MRISDWSSDVCSSDLRLDPAELAIFLHRRLPVYDRDGDGHYNLISALHKAMRGSDPQASLYWLARMLVAGEEPLYVLRRITRFASEDIGLAAPQALVQCLAATEDRKRVVSGKRVSGRVDLGGRRSLTN